MEILENQKTKPNEKSEKNNKSKQHTKQISNETTTQNIQKLRNYKEFEKDAYNYRVDEIIANIESNNTDYIQFAENGKNLYKKLENILEGNDKILLMDYADSLNNKKSCELFALAKQIYEDLANI